MSKHLRHLRAAMAILFAVSTSAEAISPARALLHQDRLEEALPLCRQFEVLSTTNEDNFFACAWVYFRSDRVDAADKMLERLRKYYNRPEYQLLMGYDQFKKKQYDEARKSFDSLAQKYGRKPAGLTAQELSGEVYEAQGQLDTAAFLYRQVVSDDPNRGTAQWGLGRYYLAHKDIARAKDHLERTAHLWPKHWASRLKLALLYTDLNDIPEAAYWTAQAYKLNKNDPQIIDQMAIIFEKKNKIARAIKLWNKALSLNKDDKLAKDKLGTYLIVIVDSLIEAKQFKQALSEIENSGKALGSDPKLLLRRGEIFRNLGKFEKAAGDLLAYVNTNGKDPMARRELGICYLNLKLMDQALDNFSRAAELEPTTGINYAWLGYALESQGRFSDAKEAWQKALELMKDPRELERANRRLAAIEKKMGIESVKREKAEQKKEE